MVYVVVLEDTGKFGCQDLHLHVEEFIEIERTNHALLWLNALMLSIISSFFCRGNVKKIVIIHEINMWLASLCLVEVIKFSLKMVFRKTCFVLESKSLALTLLFFALLFSLSSKVRYFPLQSLRSFFNTEFLHRSFKSVFAFYSFRNQNNKLIKDGWDSKRVKQNDDVVQRAYISAMHNKRTFVFRFRSFSFNLHNY